MSAQAAALLDELIDPVGRCLTPEVAKQIAGLRASPGLARISHQFCRPAGGFARWLRPPRDSSSAYRSDTPAENRFVRPRQRTNLPRWDTHCH